MIDLEFVGPDEAETVSEIAYPLFYEVYGYEPEDVVREFLEDNQSPDAIRRQMSEGISAVRLDVNVENSGALRLYERSGYVAKGRTGLHNRRLVMEKRLDTDL